MAKTAITQRASKVGTSDCEKSMQQTYPREELLLAYLNLLIHNTLVKQRFHEFKTFLRCCQ